MSKSSGELLKIPTPRPHWRPIKSQSLGVGYRHQYLWHFPGDSTMQTILETTVLGTRLTYLPWKHSSSSHSTFLNISHLTPLSDSYWYFFSSGPQNLSVNLLTCPSKTILSAPTHKPSSDPITPMGRITGLTSSGYQLLSLAFKVLHGR